MPDRNDAPLGKVDVWKKLLAYAEERGLAIDHAYDHKVEWMEAHKGVCFCDWDSGRVCPCTKASSDFDKYNGQCLCGLLLTHKRLAMKIKNHERKLVRDEKKRLELERIELEKLENKDTIVDSKE